MNNNSLRLSSVSDSYINYLRSFPELKHIYDNKIGNRKHTRKYLGVVFNNNGHKYYIPLSTPKNSDYDTGTSKIRPDTPSIIRITDHSAAATGTLVLLGTLRLSSMIPVGDKDLICYNIQNEYDITYQSLLYKELRFIRHNESKIIKTAKVLYNLKIKEDILFLNKKKPGYLISTIDFKFAEQKCLEYSQLIPQGASASVTS